MLNMNLPLEISYKVKVHLVIHNFTAKGEEDTTTTHYNITEVYGNAMNVEMVCRWCRQFLDSQTDVSDEKWSRPSEINTNTINTLQFLIKDRCQTVDKIEHYFEEVECNPLSHGTFYENYS